MGGKITVLVGSSRADGNSAAIARIIADECRAAGKDVETYHLAKIEGLGGCRACDGCKAVGRCITKDATYPILRRISESDGIVLATPLYFNAESGWLKLVLDRFYSFLDGDFRTFLSGKQKAVIAVSCMTGEESALRCAAHLQQVCTMCGINHAGTLTVSIPGGGKGPLPPDAVGRAKDLAHELI